MFIEVYEEVEVKLTALNYKMISNKDNTCTDDPEKSISKVSGWVSRAQIRYQLIPPNVMLSVAKYVIGEG